MRKKRLFLATRLLMTLFVVFTSFNAWADDEAKLPDNGSGTEADPYLIATSADWNNLAEYVAADNNCKGLFFKMTANIGTTEEPITKPLGKQVGTNKKTDRRRFAGSFDGADSNGKPYTLTIALNTDNDWFYYNKGYCSPFAYTEGATIKNLHVAGTVTTTGPWASGLVGSTGDENNKDEATCTIDKCQISVALTANYISSDGKYGNHGGFIGIAEGDATISNSWFDGKFLGKEYQYSAGFIGINKGNSTLRNCLFNPSEIMGENGQSLNVTGSCEYVHDLNGGKSTLFDAFWLKHFGAPENAQGTKVVAEVGNNINVDNAEYVTKKTAADGNVYYVIRHNPTWLELQADIDQYQDQDVPIIVNENITIEAGTEDVALVIPENKNVSISLKGTLNRGLLSEASVDGYVIKVSSGASLNISGNGTITGGYNKGNGGGIYNEGTLTINGTTITGNFTESNGGGIYNAGTLSFDGATITGNLCKKGAKKGIGVYNANGSTFSIKGNVQINDNNIVQYNSTASYYPHNVYLAGSGQTISIAGTLGSGTSIGVEASTSGVFTDGLSGNGNLDMFFSDLDTHFIRAEGEEAYLSEAENLSLNNNIDNSTALGSVKTGYLYNITLDGRTLYKDNAWNTLCLPFDVTTSSGVLAGDGVKAKTLTSASFSNGTLTLTFGNASSIKAGTPFIVKWNNTGNDLSDPVFEAVTVKNTTNDKTCNFSDGTGVTFTGTFSVAEISSVDNTKLFLQGNNELYYPNGTYATTIQAFTAYFQLNGGLTAGDTQNPAPIQRTILDFGDGTTAIAVIEDGRVKTNEEISGWYDLSGRKLSGQPSAKGIYIVNGQKVAIK